MIKYHVYILLQCSIYINGDIIPKMYKNDCFVVLIISIIMPGLSHFALIIPRSPAAEHELCLTEYMGQKCIIIMRLVTFIS